MTWATIVFIQGEEADLPLSLIDSDGPMAAVEYLSQWDYGERDDVRKEPPWGPHDNLHRIVDAGYETVLAWNAPLSYIGLHQLVETHVDYPHEPGYLHDCPACYATCHCAPRAAECVFEGVHRP